MKPKEVNPMHLRMIDDVCRVFKSLGMLDAYQQTNFYYIKLKNDYDKKVVILQAEKEAARTKKKKMRTLMNEAYLKTIIDK